MNIDTCSFVYFLEYVLLFFNGNLYEECAEAATGGVL